jgi:2-keto-4-pentenoate hydratase
LRQELESLVALLIDKRASGDQIEEHAAVPEPVSIEEAYGVQAEVARRAPKGIAGWKVGMTSKAAMRSRGRTEPVYARLFHETTSFSKIGFPPARGRKMIEAEYVIELGRDLPRGHYTREELLDAAANLRPGVELCGSRFATENPLPLHLSLADNSFHFGMVVGSPIPQWREGYLDQPVRVLADNGQVTDGTARNVLGDPFLSLQWLAGLDLPDGGLKAGDLVATGTAATVNLTTARATVVADFGHYGQVWAEFT